MYSPAEQNTRQTDRPACLDVSPERLHRMSPSQLAEAMEEALELMTEETYDPAVIDAYLDALDSAAPMPECPDTETALADLERRVEGLSLSDKPDAPPARRTARGRRGLRAGLAAVLAAACLLGGMVVTQAAGLDVFGALARWTEDVFSFGSINLAQNPNTLSEQSELPGQSDVSQQDADVPEEYQELKVELEKRGIPLYIPNIPDGFEAGDSVLYIYPETGNIEFTVSYTQNSNYITYDLLQHSEPPLTLYEKNISNVEEYEFNGITYYILNNADYILSTWNKGNIEYSLTTNLSVNELKQIL